MPDLSRRWEHESKRKSRLEADGEPFWRKHEKRSSTRTAGLDRPRPHKGDGTSYAGLFLRECKSTVGESLSVKKEWLATLDRMSLRDGKHPLLVIGFAEMEAGVDRQWACVPLSLFNEIVKNWRP